MESRMVEALMKMRLEGARRQARLGTPVRLAGRAHPGWLSLQGGRFLGQLGYRLVVLGERLEQYDLARSSL